MHWGTKGGIGPETIRGPTAPVSPQGFSVTLGAAHLVSLKVAECLHWDGLEGRLPTVLEGYHLLAPLLKAPNHVLIFVQRFFLVLTGRGAHSELPMTGSWPSPPTTTTNNHTHIQLPQQQLDLVAVLEVRAVLLVQV